MKPRKIPSHLREAIYYLTKEGDLLFSTLPRIDGDMFKKSWPFTDLVDPKSRVEFLREALLLGAKETEVYRIAGETGLDLQIPNVLERIGLKGKVILRQAQVDRMKVIKPKRQRI